MHRLIQPFLAPPSVAGALTGTLFFTASLTPSLVPRAVLTQAVLSGIAFAIGYALGTLLLRTWRYLELPLAGPRARRALVLAGACICLGTAVFALVRATQWQNSVRELMGAEPLESGESALVVVGAVAVFLAVLTVSRTFSAVLHVVSRRLVPFVPRRLAYAIGTVTAVALFAGIIDGVLVRALLRAADSTFEGIDEFIPPDLLPPEDPSRSGSAASLIPWETLGRQGRGFVTSGPARADLQSFSRGSARSPIRVYVGLNSAESIAERARLALAELERVRAFDRSALVIATPTGTGWIDPKAIDPLEYLMRGDVATVAVQYSYLPSWLTLLAASGYGAESAAAIFAEIYAHWTELPHDRRPRLYLHGMSLGALNSERAADIYDVIADPFHGALWSGPPFRAEARRRFTAQREPGSPAWLPRFRDGAVVRFTHQVNALDMPGPRWGPMRIVYLQYASDPVTFFEPEAAYRAPDWLAEPRGPDVSPQLRWFPVVTMLQLGLDIVHGGEAPLGFGHVYAPAHYLDAWYAIIEPEGWDAQEITRLKAHLADRYRRSSNELGAPVPPSRSEDTQ
jgi:uncharacterized membrane protein